MIIGILAAVALPQYNKAVRKARAADIWSTLKAIENAEVVKNLEEDTVGVPYNFSELPINFVDDSGTLATTGLTKGGVYYMLGAFANGSMVQAMPSDANVFLGLKRGAKTCGCGNSAGCKYCRDLLGSHMGQVYSDCVSGDMGCFVDSDSGLGSGSSSWTW